jgi:hypothetical protein
MEHASIDIQAFQYILTVFLWFYPSFFYLNSKSSGSRQEAHQELQVQEGHKDPHQGPLLQT